MKGSNYNTRIAWWNLSAFIVRKAAMGDQLFLLADAYHLKSSLSNISPHCVWEDDRNVCQDVTIDLGVYGYDILMMLLLL